MGKENKTKGKWYVWVSIAIVVIGVWGVYQWRAIENNKLQQAKDKQTQEQVDKDKEQRDKAMNKILLDGCLADTQTNYENNWKSLCQKLGKADDCLLLGTQANSLNESRENDKANCFKKYSQ